MIALVYLCASLRLDWEKCELMNCVNGGTEGMVDRERSSFDGVI